MEDLKDFSENLPQTPQANKKGKKNKKKNKSNSFIFLFSTLDKNQVLETPDDNPFSKSENKENFNSKTAETDVISSPNKSVSSPEFSNVEEEVKVNRAVGQPSKKKNAKNIKKKGPKIEKIEVNDSFYKAYESDATSDSSEEELKEYVKDGYHPVHVGETFKDRYRILRKLGWGAFSTVWLSHDMRNNKFVAIKIQKSGSSYYSAAEDEIEILQVIVDNWNCEEWQKSTVEYNEVNNINSCHCMHMMDHFIFEGPNGKHIGMVFEVMGSNLLKIMKKYDFEGIPLPIVRVLAKQLLISLDYLHRICNVIHTDIKPENAILCPTEEQLYQHIEDIPTQFKSHIKGRIDPSQFFSKEQNEINKRKKKNQKKKIKKKQKKKGNNDKEEEEQEEDKNEEAEDPNKPEGPIDESVQVKT